MAKAMVVCDDGQPQKIPPRKKPKRRHDDVDANNVRRMHTARKRLVGHNKRADEFRLADSPTGQHGCGFSSTGADGKQEQR